jgi:Uma2 family endonuclease
MDAHNGIEAMRTSLTLPAAEIIYPESDGKPMGETDLHRYWMNRIYDLLTLRLAGQRVYIGCDLLVYYTESRPIDYCVPDVFVALGAEPGFRRTYKTWAEGRPPTVVFEVTSAGTRREDEVFKPQMYTQMGVAEYFLYDPTADYLEPPLIGYRLTGDDRGRIASDEQGALHCQTLGLKLWLHEDDLLLADAATGRLLLTEAEAAEARADEEASQREEEARGREEEARRRQAAEAEVARLQAEIERLRREGNS